MSPPAQLNQPYLERISVPCRDTILIVPAEDIGAAEIADGSTRIYVVGESHSGRTGLRQFAVNHKLEYLEANLNPAYFMLIHRSTVVRLNKIRVMILWFSGRYKLLLDFARNVIASRDRDHCLKDRLQGQERMRFSVAASLLPLAHSQVRAQDIDTLSTELPAPGIQAMRVSETQAHVPRCVNLPDHKQPAMEAGPSLVRALRGLPGVWLRDRGHCSLGERLLIQGLFYVNHGNYTE